MYRKKEYKYKRIFTVNDTKFQPVSYYKISAKKKTIMIINEEKSKT